MYREPGVGLPDDEDHDRLDPLGNYSTLQYDPDIYNNKGLAQSSLMNRSLNKKPPIYGTTSQKYLSGKGE